MSDADSNPSGIFILAGSGGVFFSAKAISSRAQLTSPRRALPSSFFVMPSPLSRRARALALASLLIPSPLTLLGAAVGVAVFLDLAILPLVSFNGSAFPAYRFTVTQPFFTNREGGMKLNY